MFILGSPILGTWDPGLRDSGLRVVWNIGFRFRFRVWVAWWVVGFWVAGSRIRVGKTCWVHSAEALIAHRLFLQGKDKHKEFGGYA